jgi:hypothetical protein
MNQYAGNTTNLSLATSLLSSENGSGIFNSAREIPFADNGKGCKF